MTTVYTITVDARGLTEDEVIFEARQAAADYFEIAPIKVNAEILSVDIGGNAVVRVDKRPGTLIG